MPCDHVDLPGGGHAIICGRRAPVKRCVHCGRPSSRLCDYPLTGAKAGKTCDRPICAGCTTHIPPDTDYCRTHAELIEREGKTLAEVQAEMPRPVFGDPGWIKAKGGK